MNAQELAPNFQHWKLGIQHNAIGIHTFKTSRPDRYDLKLDPGGFLVYLPGLILNGDYYFKKRPRHFLRFSAAYYRDSGFNHAGFAHAGWRWHGINKGRWSVSGGAGLTFFIRENWLRVYPDRQILDPFYGDRITKNDYWQYRFFPIVPEFNLHYRINDKLELDISMVPAAIVIDWQVGLRWVLKGKQKK